MIRFDCGRKDRDRDFTIDKLDRNKTIVRPLQVVPVFLAGEKGTSTTLKLIFSIR